MNRGNGCSKDQSIEWYRVAGLQRTCGRAREAGVRPSLGASLTTLSDRLRVMLACTRCRHQPRKPGLNALGRVRGGRGAEINGSNR